MVRALALFSLLVTTSCALPARSDCTSQAPRAVELEILDCEAKTPRTFLLRTRVHAETQFSPFMKNCPRPGVSKTSAASQASFLYTAERDSGLRSCDRLIRQERLWMLASNFCCNEDSGSEACREGWGQLRMLDGGPREYLRRLGHIDGEPDPAWCGAPGHAFEVEVRGCTDHGQGSALVEAAPLNRFTFEPYPFNCPLPDREAVTGTEAETTLRLLVPYERCGELALGTRRWYYVGGQCCEQTPQARACQLDAQNALNAYQFAPLAEFLRARGIVDPASL